MQKKINESEVRKLKGFKEFWLEHKYLVRCRDCKKITSLTDKIYNLKNARCPDCWIIGKGNLELLKIKK